MGNPDGQKFQVCFSMFQDRENENKIDLRNNAYGSKGNIEDEEPVISPTVESYTVKVTLDGKKVQKGIRVLKNGEVIEISNEEVLKELGEEAYEKQKSPNTMKDRE